MSRRTEGFRTATENIKVTPPMTWRKTAPVMSVFLELNSLGSYHSLVVGPWAMHLTS